MTNAGLADYAHLRVRECRPGPSRYVLRPLIGPESDSVKKTILNRHNRVSEGPTNTAVGPGSYTIPSTIGTGRAVDLRPHSPSGNRKPSPQMKNRLTPSRSPSVKRVGTPCKGRDSSSLLRPLTGRKENVTKKAQELIPGVPAFSIAGRLKGYFDVDPAQTCSGMYTLPSCFDIDSGKKPPAGTFGGRYDSPVEREKRLIPGPGTYNTTTTHSGKGMSILDRVDSPNGGGRTGKASAASDNSPGPGAYGDPTTIAHRLQKHGPAFQKWTGTSTFGGRPEFLRELSHPATDLGPAVYNTTHASDYIDAQKKKTTVVFRPQTLSSESARGVGRLGCMGGSGQRTRCPADCGYYPITLPSDFDKDCRKGVKMLGRHWPGGHTATDAERGDQGGKTHSAASPRVTKTDSFHLDQEHARRMPCGGRFAARPYTALLRTHPRGSGSARARGKDAASEREGKGALPGPGSYDPNYAVVSPRSYRALLSATPHPAAQTTMHTKSIDVRDERQQCEANGVSLTGEQESPSPGPGHYYPDYAFTYAKSHGTLFHKGDFHMRNGMPYGALAEAAARPGAGTYYNDVSLFSGSIAAGVTHGIHDKSFGVRYPARALIQACKPRDETTNTNCIYANEYDFYFDLPKNDIKTVK